jgi:hypothetical protein
MAFKRDDWNALIDKVNALITSNGLSAVPLVEVAKGHVWKKDDVQLVRNKLTEICTNHPAFSVTLNKWSQKLIAELSAAISACQCSSLLTCYEVTQTICGYYHEDGSLVGTQTYYYAATSQAVVDAIIAANSWTQPYAYGPGYNGWYSTVVSTCAVATRTHARTVYTYSGSGVYTGGPKVGQPYYTYEVWVYSLTSHLSTLTNPVRLQSASACFVLSNVYSINSDTPLAF